MRVDCKNCGKKIVLRKAAIKNEAEKLIKNKVSVDMKKIDTIGLREFIKSTGMSIRGFARVLGVNSKTVDNWLRVQRLSGVARKAIEGGLARWHMGIGVEKTCNKKDK